MKCGVRLYSAFRRVSPMIRFLPLSVAVLLAANASAQTTHRTLISRVDANRVSLQRAWFTRVRVDPARGRIAHVTQHVSSKHAYTVYVVTHDRGKLNFSERDIDRFGRTLGKDGAKKLADRHLADLTLQKLNPKLSTQTIPETSLYVMTDMGMVQAIDGETGRTRWTTPVGNPFYYSEAPGANDDYVAAVNGSSIFVIDQANGKIVWRRQARGCAATRRRRARCAWWTRRVAQCPSRRTRASCGRAGTSTSLN